MTSNVIVQQINGGPIGVKNAIINGNFGINQRGVSGTVTLAAGAYGHDRWKAGASGCTYTFATSENVTTLTITAGSLIQVVEDVNLLTDTYKLSWTGTAQGKIGAGSYGAAGITGSVTGGSNLNIEFNTGTVSKVQLERGSTATPFEFRSVGQELALCERYFQKFVSNNSGASDVFTTGAMWTSTTFFAVLPFTQTMRSTPTTTASRAQAITFLAAGSTFQSTSVTGQSATLNAIEISCGCTGGTAGQGGWARFTAATDWIALSSEL